LLNKPPRILLAAAPEKGHEGSVQLLFYDCASPEGRGGSFLPPQISAIIGRNNAFLDIVIDKLVDANAEETCHAYALDGCRIPWQSECDKRLHTVGFERKR
jgi:hypothetical protein